MKVCKKCNLSFEPSKGLINYCSMKCRQGKEWNDTDKKKKSEARNLFNSKNNFHVKPKECPTCLTFFKPRNNKRIFCSKKCYGLSDAAKENGSIGGKIVAALKIRRSKNEIYFYELCKSKFKNLEHNSPIFNGWDADVIIHDLKLAILWNGKWHYEKITEKHSVEQVQNRDKIKKEEIKKFGYTCIEIKDMGRYNKDFVNEKFTEIFSAFV